VAESTLTERTPEDVLDDFVKLMQVRVPVKVLVFTMDPVILVPKLIAPLRAYTRHQEGDGYLLIRIDWSGAVESQKVVIGPGGSVPIQCYCQRDEDREHPTLDASGRRCLSPPSLALNFKRFPITRPGSGTR